MNNGKTVLFGALAVLFICCGNAEASSDDYGTFESFYEKGLGLVEWGLIIGIAVITAGIAYFTAGTGVPAWMSTVGGWIGGMFGLSGAAAVNFGLALLGGGSMASGGFGIAGGAAVLAFGSEVLIGYGASVAIEGWDHDRFVEATKEMSVLPIPRNEDGGTAYMTATRYLHKVYNVDDPFSEENMKEVETTIQCFKRDMVKEQDIEYRVKDNTLLALLYFHNHSYYNAKIAANTAIRLATKAKVDQSLPRFIWAVSVLSLDEEQEWPEEFGLQWPEIYDSLSMAYLQEPSNQLMPVMTACCMDRMIYRYGKGRFEASMLEGFCEIITDPSIKKKRAAASLYIFIYRCLVELKHTQNDLLIILDRNPQLLADPDVRRKVEEKVNRYEALADMLTRIARTKVPRLEKLFPDDLPEDKKVTGASLSALLGMYAQDVKNMRRRIEETAAGLEEEDGELELELDLE